MNENTFYTKVRLTVYGLSSSEMQAVESNYVTIKWSIIPEIRSWGVKSITPIILDQTISFEIEDMETEELTTRHIDITGAMASEEVSHEDTDRSSFQIAPQELVIDVAGPAPKIVVIF